MFRRETSSKKQILDLAEAEADRLGVEQYLIVVRRRGSIVTVADESELKQGDSFIGIVTDAKGGVR